MNEHQINRVSSSSAIGEASNYQQNIEVLSQNVDGYIKFIFDRQITRRKSFFERFFPQALDKTISQGEVRLAQTKLDTLTEAAQIFKDTQIGVLQEGAEHYLAKIKAQFRRETASFLVAEAQKLEAELDHIFDDFTELVENRYEKNAKYKHPLLREKMENQLEKDIEQFMELKDVVVKRFANIVKEHVNNSSAR